MKLFDEKAFAALESSIKESRFQQPDMAEEDLDSIKMAVLAFANYVYRVAEERIEVRLASGVKNGAEYRQIVESFDATRHTAHEKAIAMTGLLNRMASAYDIPPIYTGDLTNRVMIGDFCREFCDWLFAGRYQ